MEEVLCGNCKSSFLKKRSQVLRSNKHFCSSACSAKGRRDGKVIKCHRCGTKSYKQAHDLKKYEKHFCSRNCSVEWHNNYFVQEKHRNFKTGQFSYKKNLIRNGIKAYCRLCSKNDKRILLVHHIDKNRENNKLTNLVWLCHNCHFLVHHYKDSEKRLEQKLG